MFSFPLFVPSASLAAMNSTAKSLRGSASAGSSGTLLKHPCPLVPYNFAGLDSWDVLTLELRGLHAF